MLSTTGNTLATRNCKDGSLGNPGIYLLDPAVSSPAITSPAGRRYVHVPLAIHRSPHSLSWKGDCPSQRALTLSLIARCAFGDYDNDGDIDVLVLNMNDYPSLLRNDGGNKKNWITIKLLGTQCNRTAIGARVKVVTGKHAQIDEVHAGTSVMSQSDLRLHFGLGLAPRVDLIEVHWPTTRRWRDLRTSPPINSSPLRKAQESSNTTSPTPPRDPDASY